MSRYFVSKYCSNGLHKFQFDAHTTNTRLRLAVVSCTSCTKFELSNNLDSCQHFASSSEAWENRALPSYRLTDQLAPCSIEVRGCAWMRVDTLHVSHRNADQPIGRARVRIESNRRARAHRANKFTSPNFLSFPTIDREYSYPGLYIQFWRLLNGWA